MLFKAVCLARWRAIAASEPFNAAMRRTELHGRLPSSETARIKLSIVSSDPDWTFGLQRGELVRIFDAHAAPDGQHGYSVEVFNPLGETIAVTAVPESALQALQKNAVLSVCELTLTR